ncbi:hypothetical protein BOTBODRAFT_27173 [Botryobasidium botryosum FD-172 SS1]|uniref:Uncharacterized protein n=1 Tax=Botryobasidium botryosum (strain FD-172 SS1) TaxID=930990 RepID=A0A067MVI1_BOTB1|nr:hypothetical protein BOTBODRAFT_27173 [Botryobasidium botryosum FD-172 SS1]
MLDANGLADSEFSLPPTAQGTSSSSSSAGSRRAPDTPAPNTMPDPMHEELDSNTLFREHIPNGKRLQTRLGGGGAGER